MKLLKNINKYKRIKNHKRKCTKLEQVSAWLCGLIRTLLDLMHNNSEIPGSNPGAGKANQTFHPSGVDKLVAAIKYTGVKLTVQ